MPRVRGGRASQGRGRGRGSEARGSGSHDAGGGGRERSRSRSPPPPEGQQQSPAVRACSLPSSAADDSEHGERHGGCLHCGAS
eukprot:8347835-Alexandrium_andersonii.AAC.1